MILKSEKKLVPLKELKPVNVNFYNELSVKKLYEEFSARSELKPYFPPSLNKGQTLDA